MSLCSPSPQRFRRSARAGRMWGICFRRSPRAGRTKRSLEGSTWITPGNALPGVRTDSPILQPGRLHLFDTGNGLPAELPPHNAKAGRCRQWRACFSEGVAARNKGAAFQAELRGRVRLSGGNKLPPGYPGVAFQANVAEGDDGVGKGDSSRLRQRGALSKLLSGWRGLQAR